jgi:hypothetical protein
MATRVRRQRKTFCTECGTDLDEFWLSSGPSSYEDVLKHHLECQRAGRFKGTMCSKLYILDGGTPDTARTAKALSPRKRAALKSAILKKIETEDKKARKR